MSFRNLLVKAGLAVANAAAKFEPSGVASKLLEAYAKHQEKQELRADLDEMMAAGVDTFRTELADAMGELKLHIAENQRATVEAYLSQFQTSAKQASRALGDSSATTVPATVAVEQPEQLAAFLPQRLPRFKVGDSVPGLPPWKLVEPLGAGGFGEVWKAENPYSGVAAFKFFLDPTARVRFTRTEAANLSEILKRAPTDGVVKLLGAEPDQDPPWLQFEFLGGGDLSRLAERLKSLPAHERIRQANHAVRTLARTAGHFHNLGVVHRDLKPSNVLFRKTDSGKHQLVIADFSISRILPPEVSSLPTPTNSATATIQAYTALCASPQQKKFRAADRRDDVYALGVMWYQLLRGDLGLERPSGEGWKRALRNLGVSDATIGLLDRCWDDEPEERPLDGNELHAAIKELDTETVLPLRVPQTPPGTSVAEPDPALAIVTETRVPAPARSPEPPVPAGATLAPAVVVGDSSVAPTTAPPAASSPQSLPVLLAPTSAPHTPTPGLPTPTAEVEKTGVGPAFPTTSAAEFTVEDVIREFERGGGQRGATAKAGHQCYETAARLRFVPCRCGWGDAVYNCHEFIARNSRGTCYYVCHNLRTDKITVGPKGYHRQNPDVPECVPGGDADSSASAPRRRRLEVEDIGDIAVVNFVDSKILEEQNIQMIGDDLFRLVDELGRRKVLLSFANVEFLSSAALGKLVTLHRKLQAVRGKLVLCSIAEDILDVFVVTKLDRIIAISTDEQAGLRMF